MAGDTPGGMKEKGGKPGWISGGNGTGRTGQMVVVEGNGSGKSNRAVPPLPGGAFSGTHGVSSIKPSARCGNICRVTANGGCATDSR